MASSLVQAGPRESEQLGLSILICLALPGGGIAGYAACGRAL